MSKKYVTDKIQIINNSNGIEFLKDDGVSIVLKIDANYTNTDSGLTYWNDTTKSYETDSNLTYNPSNGQLSATSFSGTFSGSAVSLKSVSTSGVMTIVGPSDSTTRQKTIRDANDTILELGGSYTPTGNWVWTSGTHTWPTFNQSTTGSAGSVSNSVTFNNGGTGGASGSSFNGSSALTVSYNTVGAAASSHNHDSDYLSLNGGTLTGDLTIGATNKTSDTTLKILAGDLYNAGIELYGSSQGTGYVYVGQSLLYGGGFYYDGDGNPTFITGESADRVIFYANSNGNKNIVFDYSGGGVVNFRSTPTVNGTSVALTTELNSGTVTSVAAGDGMDFTTITGSGSVTMGKPSSCSLLTSNAVTSTSHTHQITGVLSNSSTSTQTGSFGTLYVRTSLNLFDNDILVIGSGSDVEFFYNGSDFYTDLNALDDNWYIRFNPSGTLTTKFRLNSDGQFDADGDIIAYSSSVSDKRLKENINTLTSSLDKVLKLRGVNFEWKEGYKDGNHIGYIAQEVEEIIPEVVIERNLMKYNNEKYKIIRYEEIIPYLSEAIKEQQNIINELKEEINILKNKIK